MIRFILTIFTCPIKQNRFNIGLIYDRTLQGLVPEASLICLLFHHTEHMIDLGNYKFKDLNTGKISLKEYSIN